MYPDCYVNDPPEIKCADASPVIVGQSGSRLTAGDFFSVTDKDNDVVRVDLKVLRPALVWKSLQDQDGTGSLDAVEHLCGSKPQVSTRRIEITAVDKYTSVTAVCEVIFGECQKSL